MDFFNNFDQQMNGNNFNDNSQMYQDDGSNYQQHDTHYQDMGHATGMEHSILNIGDTTPVDGYNHDLVYVDNGNMYYDVGNAHEMINYSDPLIHSGEYHCAPLHLHAVDLANQPLVHVDGYVKDDGTYVHEHLRTAPNGIKEDNISYQEKLLKNGQ